MCPCMQLADTTIYLEIVQYECYDMITSTVINGTLSLNKPYILQFSEKG